MELLYVWIERFNNIVNQEFCFTTEYDIKFDSILKNLSIKTKEKKSVKLFDEAFLNVTAIIGKNGSGKTSFIYFLKHLFTTEEVRLSEPFLLILKDKNDNIITISKIDLTILKNLNINITNLDITKSIKKLNDSISLIFHSNTFSAYYEVVENRKYYDVSLNSSLFESSIDAGTKLLSSYDDFTHFQKDKPHDENYKRTREYLIRSHIPQLYFQQQEIKSNLDFISTYQSEQFDFIPKFIDVGFNPVFFTENLDYFSSIGFDIALRRKFHYQIFKKSNEIYENPSEDIKLFKKNIILYLFLSYLTNYYFKKGGIAPEIKELIENLKKIDKDYLSDEIYKFIIEYQIPRNDIFFEPIKQFILKIDNKFDLFSNFHKLYNGQLSFEITDNLLKTINELFTIWYPNEFIFTLDWRGLSTGESALLNLFSRIQSLVQIRYVGDTVWLLIDEGDLYLHPEWQRTLLNDLHKYLPLFFKNKKIQLILTSHAPFLVSDLPKEHIILLNKETVTGKCIVVKTEDIKNTFAANINSLYADAFFMEGGLIGEFAKQKIEDLIKYLTWDKKNPENKPKENWDDDKARDVINVIGEPILQEHLENLWLKKSHPEFANKSREDLIKIIKELENTNIEKK